MSISGVPGCREKGEGEALKLESLALGGVGQ